MWNYYLSWSLCSSILARNASSNMHSWMRASHGESTSATHLPKGCQAVGTSHHCAYVARCSSQPSQCSLDSLLFYMHQSAYWCSTLCLYASECMLLPLHICTFGMDVLSHTMGTCLSRTDWQNLSSLSISQGFHRPRLRCHTLSSTYEGISLWHAAFSHC